MAGITLEQAEAQLALWITANTALSTHQEYEISANGSQRRLRRADIGEVRENIKFWDSKARELSAAVAAGLPAGSRRRIRYVVPE